MNRMWLYVLLLTKASSVATAVTGSNSNNDDYAMAIYHHIHHIEFHHGISQSDSILLDITRQRLRQFLNNGKGKERQPPSTLLRYNANQKVDLAADFIPAQFGGGGSYGSITNYNKHSTQSKSDQKSSMATVATTAMNEGAPGMIMSRALASNSDFSVDAVWSESPRGTKDQEDSTDDQECKDICKCLASELLFGITKVLPYKTNYEAEEGPKEVFQFKCAPDTTPIWYRKHKKKWEWNPSDPADSYTDFVESDWETCGSDDVAGGAWCVAFFLLFVASRFFSTVLFLMFFFFFSCSSSSFVRLLCLLFCSSALLLFCSSALLLFCSFALLLFCSFALLPQGGNSEYRVDRCCCGKQIPISIASRLQPGR
jgi:hypothetical protein